MLAKKSRKCLLLLALTALFSQAAHADGNLQNPYAMCSITLRYYDGAEGSDPIAGARFAFMRVASLKQTAADRGVGTSWQGIVPTQGGNLLHVDERTKASDIYAAVVSAYSGKTPAGGYMVTAGTDASGIARASNLPEGIYLVRETAPAKEHLPSAPFLVAVPFTSETGTGKQTWRFDAEAEPKPQPCGDLVISKVLKGSGADLKAVFHFEVTFDRGGSFHYRKTGGKTGRVKSGSVIALKGGESVVIDTIPVGTAYRVREKEANAGGYKTTSTGASGRIRRKTQALARFVNEKKSAVKKTTAAETYAPVRALPPTAAAATKSTSPVRTGDGNPLLAHLLLMTAAAVMIVMTGRKKTRR